MMNFKRVFDEYIKIYQSIFDILYPSKNSTGFQERNQTVNFVKAYEKIYSKDRIASWFEFQFGERNDNHLDVVIVNKTRKEIYLIESKRYSNENKLDSSIKDYIRITEEFRLREFENRLDNYNDYSVYGIILADVWTENDAKSNIYNEFENVFLKDIATHYKSDVSSNTKCINDNYKLLAAYFTVRHGRYEETNMKEELFKKKLMDFNSRNELIHRLFTLEVKNNKDECNNIISLVSEFIKSIQIYGDSVKEFKYKIRSQIDRWNEITNEDLDKADDKKENIIKKIGVITYNYINDIQNKEELEEIHNSKKTILFTASMPKGFNFIRFDREYQNLIEINEIDYNSQYVIIPVFCIKKEDLEQKIAKYKPYILHFSGHGGFDNEEKGYLLFETRFSTRAYLYPKDFTALLNNYNIPLIFLNSCYSAHFIEDLQSGYGNAIGDYYSVLDEYGIEFSQNFYHGLIRNKYTFALSYNNAYDLMDKKIKGIKNVYDKKEYENSHSGMKYF